MGKVRASLAVAAAAILSAFALAACGDDDGGSSEDEDQITAAIERAATSGDPAACTEVQTAKFTQQTSGEPGESAEAAVKTCEEDAANTAADEVEVTSIEVDGDTATAQAAATGNTFDGQTLDIALVKEDDQWKLDGFRGFVDFDRDAMIAAFRQQLEDEADVSAQALDCVIEQFESASDEDLEAFFTGTNPNGEQFFAPCEQFSG